MIDRAEVERRLPVWRAFGISFLDTQFDDDHYASAGREVASTPFSCAELETMFQREVAPALAGNLWFVAGEWAGWHDEFLRECIARGRPNRFTAWLRTLGLGAHIDEEWRRWEHAIRCVRSDSV